MSKRHLAMTPTKLFGRLMEAMNAAAYREAIQGLPARGAVLEIGFGTGRFLEMLAASGSYALIAGIDPTPAMVAMAGARPALRQPGSQADIRLGTAESLPWGEATFDAVVAIHCFQFWSDPHAAVQEVRRVLKTGGLLRLVLRAHGAHPPDWLPNPISRAGDEDAGASALLSAAAFEAVLAGPGHRIDARKPA